MLRDDDGDAAVIDYCRTLAKELGALSAFGEPVRVLLDTKAVKAPTNAGPG
jgi:prolyl-tRNA synthetase